jgi:hypothetical protein
MTKVCSVFNNLKQVMVVFVDIFDKTFVLKIEMGTRRLIQFLFF